MIPPNELYCTNCEKPLAHIREWHTQEACDRWFELLEEELEQSK